MTGKKPAHHRPPAPTHVLRHVRLQDEPRALPGRGRAPSPPPAVPAAMTPTAASATRAAAPFAETAPATNAQWQAGHRQGLAEGREAGYAQARKEFQEAQAEEGFKQGYEAGVEQARGQLEEEAAALAKKLQQSAEDAVKKARQESAQQLRRLDQMIQALPGQLSERLAAMEDDVVALCFDVVCRMLGERLATPAGVRAFVVQASKDWPADADLAVHLHPDDLALLRDAPADDFVDSSRSSMQAHLTAELEQRVRPPVQWVADPSVGAGGCVLRSSKGGLDARLSTQMENLAALLLQARAQRRDHRHPVGGAAASALNLSSLDDVPASPKGKKR